MANTSEGKLFEKDVQASSKKQGICIIRLNDTSLSWVKERKAAFTPKNPCDFIMYRYPYMMPLECKSTMGTSITIQRSSEENKAMIHWDQIKSLTDLSTYDGILCGFLLNFRDEGIISENKTYWISISDFNEFLNNTEKKSINAFDIVNHNGILVENNLKRTRHEYNISKMIDDIVEYIKNKG